MQDERRHRLTREERTREALRDWMREGRIKTYQTGNGHQEKKQSVSIKSVANGLAQIIKDLLK